MDKEEKKVPVSQTGGSIDRERRRNKDSRGIGRGQRSRKPSEMEGGGERNMGQ